MILLNKFIFGELDKFKKGLGTRQQSSRLSKDISVFHNYGRYDGTCSYQGKKLYISMFCIEFKNSNFTKHENMKLDVSLIKYEKHIYPNYIEESVLFKMNHENNDLYILTSEPSTHYGIVFSFSDEKSIANVMSIIRLLDSQISKKKEELFK